jgi:hypothetical protein
MENFKHFEKFWFETLLHDFSLHPGLIINSLGITGFPDTQET